MPKWKPNADVVMRPEDEGMYLAFNVTAGSGLILNPTAHFIYTRAAEGCPAEEIAQAIQAHFDFPAPAPSRADLSTLVSTHITLLERARLLTPEEQTLDDVATTVRRS